MTQHPLSCRALTVQDLERVTQIHRDAFPKSALTALGERAVFRYYDWLLTGPHDALNIGVYQDGILRGFLCGGKFRGALSGFLERNRGLLAWRVLTRPYLIANPLFRERLELGVRLVLGRWRQVPVDPHRVERQPSFGILAIAVDPHVQGGGAGRLLMQEAERVAREREYRFMNLSVAQDNAQAIGFYEHLGWEKSQTDPWDGHMFKALG